MSRVGDRATRPGRRGPRVVHVVVAGETGGAERMLVDLASRPGATGAEHAVALFTPNDSLRRMLRDAGLRVHDRGRVREGPLTYLWRSLGPRDVAWLEGILRGERADVAHLHTFASQVLGTRAARRAGARVLRTEHSTRVYEDPSCWPFSRWSLARAHAAVAVSEHVRRVALARAPWAAETMRVVANGVDVTHFAPRDDGKAEAFTFVVVGRLEPRKGVDLAVEALAKVPGARLDILGAGGERAKLEAQVAARDLGERVRFLGYADDARPLLARAHAALCSSRSEGLGIALLEGMAMGLPVVGFAVGGVPEIVVDGATGMLCTAGDVEALAATMRTAAGARARMEAMGKAARERVVARFSVGAMCEGYRAVYAGLGR
ncbi:MAG TPA: glycosyltransferase family 4 protein [Polyangiaceae bacterium]|nr:glycosyltransferase family 4 protein [Polyangiaceae bacterium]